jgi:hypothetical protein
VNAYSAAPGTGISGERQTKRKVNSLPLPLRDDRGIENLFAWMPRWWQEARVREVAATFRLDAHRLTAHQRRRAVLSRCEGVLT